MTLLETTVSLSDHVFSKHTSYACYCLKLLKDYGNNPVLFISGSSGANANVDLWN